LSTRRGEDDPGRHLVPGHAASYGPSRQPSIVAAHCAIGGAQIAFGLFPVIGALAFRPGAFSPLGMGAWRIAGGASVLGLLAAFRFGRAIIPRRSDLPRLFVCALLGVAINQGLFLVGLSRSTPMNAGIVMALIPVFTFAVAAATRQETFSASRLAGVGLALVGIAPLLLAGPLDTVGAHAHGNVLMVANALAYAFFLVLAKPLTRRYPALVVTAWSYILSLVVLPYFIVGERLLPQAGHPGAWLSLAYIIVFPTVVSYLLNMFALVRLRASTIAVYVYTQPIVTGLTSWIVFAERPSITMLLSAGALFGGVWLVARQPPAPQAPAAA